MSTSHYEFDLFLSYSSDDKARVRRLAALLREKGFRVWFDEWVIKLGDDIYLAIERGLETSRLVIACMSPKWLASEWAGLERSTAIYRNPSNLDRRFIPLLLVDCTIPVAVRRLRYLDYRRESQSAFEELVAACREDGGSKGVTQLGVPISSEEEFDELADRAQASVTELTEAWLTHLRRTGRPHIDLRAVKLDQEGRQTEELTNLDGIRQSLREGDRIILEAPAGRGKTTTLVELAKGAGPDELTFLIDLPHWVKSNLEILDYLAQLRFFKSRGIDASDLAKLYDVERFSFLLNGWNEVSEGYSENAGIALRTLERDYPRAGICLATRTRLLTPPLPGAYRVKLLPLTREQRNNYLTLLLASRATELASTLNNHPVLDQLTQTPLILSAVTDIFLSGGAIPTTRIGVLRSTIRLLEEPAEHREFLIREPLKSHAEDYLAGLAIQMTGQNATRISEKAALSVATCVAIGLREAGQIASLPEPSDILDTLCDHHILERLNYQTDALSFEHQQFQELYAALQLKRRLSELVQADRTEWDRGFARDYVNEPKWEEPLRMIAEEIGVLSRESTGTADVKLGERLVRISLGIDPIFAAEISRLCGPSVWQEVRATVGQRLRSWYAIDGEEHRQGALAAMLATGSDDFKDIILPRLRSDDSQVRLGTYRAGAEFHPTVLGNDWRAIVDAWPEEARKEFVSVLAMHGSGYERFEIIGSFARADPSPKVRADAADDLIWSGSRRVLSPVLEALDDEAFELVARELDAHNIPPNVRERALAVRGRLVEQSTHPADRLRHLLVEAELGALRIPERLKEQLNQLKSVDLNNLGTPIIRPALDIIGNDEPKWGSQWVATRILEGSLWAEHWIDLVTSIPEDLKAELLEAIGSQELKQIGRRGVVAVLTAIADPAISEAVWKRLFLIRRSILDGIETQTESQSNIVRQLEELIVNFPPAIIVTGLLKCINKQIDFAEFRTVIDVFMRANSKSEFRNELPEELLEGLRGYLKNAVDYVLNLDDFDGGLKAYLATTLALVGGPGDMPDLRRLLRSDIERVKNGRAAVARREVGPITYGVGNCWADWHIRALTSLDPVAAEETLLELLCETEAVHYENDVSSALVKLATTVQGPDQLGYQVDYRAVWDMRTGSKVTRFNEERRQRYACAIKERISQMLAARDPDTEHGMSYYKLKELSKYLADLDAPQSVGLVMQVLALPGEWDAWARLKAMEALLFGGAALPAEATLNILNPAIDQIRAQGVYDHNAAWEFTRCLCVLAFTNNPALGIERVRQVLSETPLWPSALRNLFRALGASRAGGDALSLLLELRPPAGVDQAGTGEEWINAVAMIGSPEAKRVLMESIEQGDRATDFWDSERDTAETETLAARIAELVRDDDLIKSRVYELCDIQVQPAKRQLISKIIARVGTTDAMLAGLNLIYDDATPPIPHDIRRALEDAFLERRPYLTTGSYTLVGRSANQIRAKLFETSVSDGRRKESAFALLGQIEVWRLEHGRPLEEPRHPAIESGKEWPPIP